MRKFLTASLCVVALGLVIGPEALARQARTVKNYFANCSNAGCDNALTIAGTLNVDATNGGVVKQNGTALDLSSLTFGPTTAWATDASPTFTGSGAMTWTGVTVTTNRWMQSGKTVYHTFVLGPFTVGGTPAIDLRMTIPAGKIAVSTQHFTCDALENSVNIPAILGYTTAAANFLSFRKGPATTWGNFSSGFLACGAFYEVQ